MFTVRHQQWTGHEEIIPAQRISIMAAEQPCAYDNRSMWIHHESGEVQIIDEGTLFVMNANGKTVAKYALGNSDPKSLRALTK